MLLRVKMAREEFGFPIIWVPTLIVVEDNLASAENVNVSFRSDGNKRLGSSINQVVVPVTVGTANIGLLDNTTIPIESAVDSDENILSATWATNTDGKTYHLHVFGPVFDAQVIARAGHVDMLLAGVR